MACWASSYDELATGPSCATSFWPSSYDELVTGAPANDPVWPGCQWPTTYDELVTGPICQTAPEPLPDDSWIRCPTKWARQSTGGAWHLPDVDVFDGLLTVPLMHDCDLPWGHGGDHYCACTADHTKPGIEGEVTPPDETVDPVNGIMPLAVLSTMPGGPVALLLAVPVDKADTKEAQHRLENAPVD
jgi:hypothetical protein